MRRDISEPGWDHRYVTVGALRTLVRVSPDRDGAVPIVHLHGFGISGSYLMPTARRLVDRARNVVPDLPGYGRSDGPRRPLSIPALAEAAVRILDAQEIDRAVLVGNSMGCPVSIEIANSYPDRVDRIVLVSPAGGLHNQPLRRAIGQLATDGLREHPRMAATAVPDYLRFGPVNSLRLFSAMTRYAALDRLHEHHAPTLVVAGDRDPLLPDRARIVAVAAELPSHTTVVVIEGAAHAINFSHPGELAHVISAWLDGAEITDDPAELGRSAVIPIRRRP
jgi:pimeloyl-ACP methyl ester carboxylesterase